MSSKFVLAPLTLLWGLEVKYTLLAKGRAEDRQSSSPRSCLKDLQVEVTARLDTDAVVVRHIETPC